jgi:hypothetical protein
MLILSYEIPKACSAILTTTEKASLISKRAISLISRPALFRGHRDSEGGSLWEVDGVDADIGESWGGCQSKGLCRTCHNLDIQTTRARGLRPRSLAFSALVNTNAEAPSLKGDEFAAVMEPSFLKDGLSVGTFSKMTRLYSSSSLRWCRPSSP